MRCEELIEERVAVLYGEADAAAQARVDDHVAGCAECRDELRDMRALRGRLSAWKLPATLRPARPWGGVAWRRRVLPIAAVLVGAVGAGLAFAGAELRYGDGRFAFRLGPPAPSVEELVARQEARHRDELLALRAEVAALQARPAVPVTAGAPAGLVDRAQVRELIQASEDRQRAMLRAGFEVLEQRRQYDLARIKTGFSYIEGRNGYDYANTMRAVSYVLGASQPGGPEGPTPR